MSLLLALQERTIEGSVAGLIGNASGEINFTGASPVPGTQTNPFITGGGSWDEVYLKRRRQQLAKDDEEIMIFVKAFLTHHGTD